MKFLLLMLLISCSTIKVPTQVSLDRLSELNCPSLENKKYITKLDLLICLGKNTSGPFHKVSLSYNDLPKSGPMANLSFYAITNGYLKPKSLQEFGTMSLITEEEFIRFQNVYLKKNK